MSKWCPLLMGIWLAAQPASAQSPAEVEAALSAQLNSTRSLRAQAVMVAMRDMYQGRDFAPLWLGHPDKLEAASSVHTALSSAAEDGLDPADYAVQPLAGDDDRVRYELATTAAFVKAAIDLSLGRVDPAVVDDDQRVERRDYSPPTILGALTRSPKLDVLLRALAPRYAGYWRLREELALLRDAEPWPSPEFRSPKLEMGMAGGEIVSLRRFLRATGDLPSPAAGGDNATFDAGLDQAVRRFQRRHGLLEDGIIGRRTRAAMQVGMAARIRQIEANMERWRWLPDTLGHHHIWVNVANFSLALIEHDKIVHRTEVIVGRPYHRTPMFSQDMTYIVLNPYWTVPASIAVNEIIPAILTDPGYIDRNRFEVLDAEGRLVDPATIDWSDTLSSRLLYTFRQRQGGGNALGRIKFMLPNDYSVYLHDTPAKNLFQQTSRAFSHGCVRVNEPLQLAARLLGSDGWNLASLEAAVRTGRQEIVRLQTPIPVHLTYFTAWIDDDGTLQLRDDIYGRDTRLLTALDRRERP